MRVDPTPITGRRPHDVTIQDGRIRLDAPVATPVKVTKG